MLRGIGRVAMTWRETPDRCVRFPIGTLLECLTDSGKPQDETQSFFAPNKLFVIRRLPCSASLETFQRLVTTRRGDSR